MIKRRSAVLACCLLAGLVATPPAQAGSSVTAIRTRGSVLCGVAPGPPSYWTDPQGQSRGIDYDLCRALAAALFGDARAFSLTELVGSIRFEALASGEIDVLMAQATWTYDRETRFKIRFTGTSFLDGQGFLVQDEPHPASVFARRGLRLCVIDGTTSALKIGEEIKLRGLDWRIVETKSDEGRIQAFRAQRCQAMTDDRSALAAIAARMPPGQARVLDETIGDEPLSPAVRDDDPDWFRIVRWTVFAVILAEQLGVSSANVEARRAVATDPEERRLLGLDPNPGPQLGLAPDWAYQIIRQVGNYAEIYERALGPGLAGALPRGRNALVRHGGALFAPPLR